MGNPLLPTYLNLRFNDFKSIANGGYMGNEIKMRNNTKILVETWRRFLNESTIDRIFESIQTLYFQLLQYFELLKKNQVQKELEPLTTNLLY